VAATIQRGRVSGGRQDRGQVVPEVGQGEKIQRVEVSDLWGTLKIWMMPAREDDK
jgi:hypothetical protein